jgi:hypothetical protein
LNKEKEEKSKYRKYVSKSLALAVIAVLTVGLIPMALLFIVSATPVVADQSTALTNLDMVQINPRNPYSHASSGKSLAPGFCTSGYCPMGVVDYGVTSSLATYSYNARVVEGRLDVSALTMTNAAANTPVCIDHFANPGGIAHCFDIQLNWIAHNVVDGRNKAGVYWAQDVAQIGYDASCSTPCIPGTYSVTFLDNVWNFSSPTLDHNCGSAGEQGCMQSGFTGNNLNGCATSGTPKFYACVTPVTYNLFLPFTIWNTIKVTTCGASSTKSCFTFQGIVLQNNQFIVDNTYDRVIFSNTVASNPSFRISGTGLAPYPLPWDGEWVATGPCCGLGYIPILLGTWQEFYSPTISFFPVSVKHAWSSGSDTSEGVLSVGMYGFSGGFDSATSCNCGDNYQTSLW